MLPEAWRGLVDDAAVFPPGDAPLPEALTAYVDRADVWWADLVGSFVVTDTALPDVTEDVPVSIVVTGGAGAIGGALGYAAKRGKRVAGLEVALRDPDDLAGNARRVQAAVDAARAEGVLDDETPVYVELPQAEADHGWLAAADVVAEGEHRLKLRTGGLEADKFPAPATVAAGSTRPSTARRRSSAPPGCTTPSPTATTRPGSSTTASSTCCSRPGRRSTGRPRRRSRRCWPTTTPTTWSPWPARR